MRIHAFLILLIILSAGCVAPNYSTKPGAPTATPAATNNPPSVSVSYSPTNPTASDAVTITASATDDKGLSEITVYADEELKVTCDVSGTLASCPYAETFPAGEHSYYATAMDKEGNLVMSQTESFTVY